MRRCRVGQGAGRGGTAQYPGMRTRIPGKITQSRAVVAAGARGTSHS